MGFKNEVGIENIEYIFPEKYKTSRDLADELGFQLSFIEGKIGTKKIYIAGENETTSDLAAAAARKCFHEKPGLESKVGVIAVCTQTPDFQLPHTAAIVHRKLGLKTDVPCFDVGLGCSGFVYGISIVKSFMETNEIDYGLLITAETYSKIINDNDKNTKPLFSDAAAATLLSRQPSLKPLKFTFGTDGSGYDSLILRSGMAAGNIGDNSLYMDGRGIYNFVASVVPEDVNRCLKLNNMKLEDIDKFVFHQASNFMLDTLARKLSIKDESSLVKDIANSGNTVSSSIPIALKSILSTSYETQLKLLISGFGVGLSWASTILITD